MTAHEIEGEHESYAQLIDVSTLPMWVLHTIYVPHRYRGCGYGSDLLIRAIAAAPADQTLVLAPVPDADCPIDIVAWYERHGFRRTLVGLLMERGPAFFS